MHKFIVMLLAILFFSSAVKAETKFKVDQTYSNFIQLDNDSKNMQIPLPKGNWTVVLVNTKPPSSQGSILVQVYLINKVDKKLKGALRFMYAYENNTSGWRAPHNQCGYSGNLHVEDNGLYDGTQSDCWRVWGVSMNTKKSGAARESLIAIQKRGLKIPTQMLGVEYYRLNYGDFYVANYFKNPEYYGIPKPESSDGNLHDYKPDRINQFPEKKAFVDTYISWSKSWKKLIDLGFKGKLSKELMQDINR